MRKIAVWVLSLSVLATPAAYAGGTGSGDPSGGGASSSSSGSSSGATTAATTPPAAPVGPAPSSAMLQSEIDEMRAIVQLQSEQIKKQQDELAEMKAQLAARTSSSAAAAPTSSSNNSAPASQPTEVVFAAAPPAAQPAAITLPDEVPAAATTAATSTSKSAATLAADTAAPQHSPLSFRIGDATFTPLGFLDLTDVFRTTGTGNGIGTTFGGVPYNNNLPTAGLTEDRFSAQNSRIGVRVDAPVGGGNITGYIEADFLGITAANANVTSNSNTLRMRNYFADYRRGKFEILAGQDWSLLTPNRKGLSPYPSDIFFSQDMDTNYQVGLTWTRQPQIRFIYHPNDTWAMGFSIENSDQLLGSAATTPSAFNPTTGTSYIGEVDVASGSTLATPATPNVSPDFIFKIAADPKVGNTTWHFDFAGLLSEFKLVTPGSIVGGASRATNSATGGGFEANLNLELVKNFHWIGTAYWSDGGGRYLFGQGPDLVISQATTTSAFTPIPLKAGSTITGFEWQATPKTLFDAYYGGDYFGRAFSQDPSSITTKLVGYGFTGGANSQNRSIQEGTIGWTQTFFKSPNFGAFALITQGSYLTRAPWFVAAAAPHDAHLFMVYVDLRYTLP
jgi:hypothetical protein